MFLTQRNVGIELQYDIYIAIKTVPMLYFVNIWYLCTILSLNWPLMYWQKSNTVIFDIYTVHMLKACISKWCYRHVK